MNRNNPENYNQVRPLREKRRIDEKKDLTVKRKLKLIMLRLFMIGSFVYLGGRIIYINVAFGDQYERAAVMQSISSQGIDQVINPIRGSIYDRDMNALVNSVPVYRIILDPNQLNTRTEAIQEETFAAIEEILGISRYELNQYMAKDPTTGKLLNPTYYKVIMEQVPMRDALLFEERNIQHIHLEKDSKRVHVYDQLASQVLGFIRGGSKFGLEQVYDTQLTGVPGRMFRTYDVSGDAITEEIPAEEGQSLVTTIDLDIQKIAEEVVKDAGDEFNPKHASIIVMNPNTAEIYAMAEYPSFNASTPDSSTGFTSSLLAQEFDLLSTGAGVNSEQIKILDGLWNSYNVMGTIQPGSTFKPALVASALEEKIISKTQHFNCDGFRMFNNVDEPVKCWVWPPSSHGSISLSNTLACSCNVAMMDIVEQLGKNSFYKYQTDFGFGEKTGIDLPGEPSSADLKNIIYSVTGLTPIQLATSSFGQGFACTPLQAINSFAAVINGGNLMEPYLVSQIIDSNGNIVEEKNPTVVRKVISEDTSDFVREALAGTIAEGGTGASAIIPGYTMAGKTGTAQVGDVSNDEYALSYIAYFPVDDPQYLAMVLVDTPANNTNEFGGGVSVGPMIKSLMENIFSVKNIQPNDNTVDVQPIGEAQIQLPDFTGSTVNETISRLNNMGLKYQLIGSTGNIVSGQRPAANEFIQQDGQVFLNIQLTDGNVQNLFEVPNLIDATVSDAQVILGNSASYIVERSSFDSSNVGISTGDVVDLPEETLLIYEQYPRAGVLLEPGFEMILRVR